jgi:Putative lactococcus lactis phage r1t holin
VATGLAVIWTAVFWRAAGERAIKAFCYSLLGMLGGGLTDVVDMPWVSAAKIAAGVAVISVLGSIVSSSATGGGPSLTNAEELPK